MNDFCSEKYKESLKEVRDQLRQQKEQELMDKYKNEKSVQQQATPSEQNLDTAWYELIGVITHKGRSADGGHYVVRVFFFLLILIERVGSK